MVYCCSVSRAKIVVLATAQQGIVAAAFGGEGEGQGNLRIKEQTKPLDRKSAGN